MLGFILRRLLIIVPMALLVVSVTWILIRAAPGSFYSEERALPPAIEANIREKYGLDKPFYQQYLMMLGNVLKGDFGDSLRYQEQSVNEIIMRHLPYSATIGALAYLLALIIGLTAGIIAALRQNSAFDYGSMAFAMLGLSVPNFVLGPILVIVFSLWLFWLPPARWGGLSNLILPVFTLAAIYMAYIARLTRAGNAGDHAVRLYPNRAGQGVGREDRSSKARASRRHRPGRIVHGPCARLAAGGNGRRRKGLRHTRPRQHIYPIGT
jgi:oligopeptide transport system permease protein